MNPTSRPGRIVRIRARRHNPPNSRVVSESSKEEGPVNVICPYNRFKPKENLLNVICSSQRDGICYRKKLFELGCRRMVENKLFRECSVPVATNKVFCSEWLSDKHIIMGTKCNKLALYDINADRVRILPSLQSSPKGLPSISESGIHALAINPSRTLMVTGGPRSNEIAVYSLPDLQPICVGESGHNDWVFDLKWIDDEFFVSGGRDRKIVLWHINTTEQIFYDEPSDYFFIKPMILKTCEKASKVRALSFKYPYHLTALSTNSYVHQWDVTNLTQVSSHKLPYSEENICLVHSEENNVFAVGSSSHVSFMDSSNYNVVKSVELKCKGAVRSLSFRGDLLTVGTAAGALSFYDLKAGRFFEHSEQASTSFVALVNYQLFVDLSLRMFDDFFFTNAAIYTHSYDVSGTRLFTGGGPLTMGAYGCYAALWK